MYAYISIHHRIYGVLEVTNNSHSKAYDEGLVVEMSKLVCGELKFNPGLLLVNISPPFGDPYE